MDFEYEFNPCEYCEGDPDECECDPSDCACNMAQEYAEALCEL